MDPFLILSPVLDHTRIIKYHTLKYVRIVKNIKYAHDTRIITQVGTRTMSIRSIRKAFTIRGITRTRRGRGTSKQSRQQSTDGVK